MKSKRVNRYYCDHCKKSGGSKRHMERHEKGCTANPNRRCAMCDRAQNGQVPMEQLTACLPSMDDYLQAEDYPPHAWYDKWREDIAKGMSKLRQITNNCPACICAALRHRGIPWSYADFHFQKECEAFWKRVNEDEAI